MVALKGPLGALGRRASRLLRGGEGGFTLIEVLVAVAILGVVAVAMLSALSTGYLALILADENTISESLTRTSFERIRNADFQYGPDDIEFPSIPTYNVSVEMDIYEVGDSSLSAIQVWTVTVTRDGKDQDILVTSTYKVNPFKDLPP